jgi:hypothetical protein
VKAIGEPARFGARSFLLYGTPVKAAARSSSPATRRCSWPPVVAVVAGGAAVRHRSGGRRVGRLRDAGRLQRHRLAT